MRKAVLLALVAVLVAAFLAFENTLAWVGQQGPLIPFVPMSATCQIAQTAALTTPTEVGSSVAKSLGGLVHDAATKPPPSSAAVKSTVDGVLGVVESWWADFTSAARGQDAPRKGPRLLHQYPPGDPRGRPNLADYASCAPCPGAAGEVHAANFTSGLSGAALARAAASRAGFPASQLDTAVQVAGAESSYSPTATNRNTNGSTDYGMWQINSVHPAELAAGDWTDPYANARMALSVWRAAGGSWSPWTTYTSGAYRAVNGADRHQFPAVPCAAARDVAAVTPAGGPAPAVFDQQGNPRTVDQAVAFDLAMVANRTREARTHWCDHYVAYAYGWPSSGSTTARAHWAAIPAALKHAGMSPPPRGALVFWATSAAGHVAISLGDGRVITTDQHGLYLGIVPLTHYDSAGRIGWAAPVFPGNRGAAS